MVQTLVTVEEKDNRYNKNLSSFQCNLSYFFVFSFLGWTMETIYSYFVLGYFANRGFFYGPICPIYGFGGLILISFLDKFKNNPVKLFFSAIIVFSIFEYAIGYGLDAMYGLWLWDYRTEFLNINGRICFFYSLVWGFVAIIFNYVVFPLFKKFTGFISKKTPVKLQTFLLRICSIIFIIDVIYSFIQYSQI